MKSNALRSPTNLLGGATLHLAVGDVVRTGDNFHPHYHVIAVAEDRAWIRDIQHSVDHIVPIDRCRKVQKGGA